MKFISFLLTLVLLSQNAIAACDYSSDIKKIDATHYSYTVDCHVEFGNDIQKLALMTQEELDLKKVIADGTVALNAADARTRLWMDSSTKAVESLNNVEKLESREKIIYFVLGILFTSAAVWGAGQLKK